MFKRFEGGGVTKKNPDLMEEVKLPEKNINHYDQVFQIYSDHCVDDEGSIVGWMEFEYVDQSYYAQLAKEIEASGFHNLENFLYDKKTIEKLIQKINKEKDAFGKILMTKLLGDATESMIVDEEAEEAKRLAMDCLERISKDENSSYFLNCFAHTLHYNNLRLKNWWNDDVKEEEAEIIDKMHKQELDERQFAFTPEMVNKMNHDGCVYGAPSQIYSSGEAMPEKDYFVVDMAPEIIGVFSAKGNLLGWQNVTLSKDNDSILNSPMEIRDQINFSDPKKDLALFKILSSLPFRNHIERDLGIDLSKFDLRTQYQFLQYIERNKKAKISKLKQLLGDTDEKNNYSIIVKAFLVGEIDWSAGESIITLLEELDSDVSRPVFQKIAELTNLAQKKEDELTMVAYKEKRKALPEGMRTELLCKVRRIILSFSAELKSGEKADEGKIQKLLSDLEKSRIDIEIMAALLTATKKAGAEQNVSEIKGVEMETASEKELRENPALEEKLTEMYRASIEHKSKEDQARLLSDFETHKQHNPRFHLVYFDKDNKDQPKKSLENLVGFMRSSAFNGQRKLSEGERYLGAMNIDSILQKFYFGENFLREIVEKEITSGAKKLIAHCPENGPSHKIVKLLGFETVSEDGDYRDDDGKIMAKRIRVELVKK